MRLAIPFVLLLPLGCGGGVGQEDIMRAARARAAINATNDANEEQAKKEKAKREKEQAAVEGSVASASAPNAGARKTPAVKIKEPGSPTLSEKHPTRRPEEGALVKEEAPGNSPIDDASSQLQEIAASLTEYRTRERRSRFMTSLSRLPDASENLSWRVHLLPYLGYDDLYKRFDIEKDWDREPNRSLLNEMPEVYAAEGLDGTRTRFVAVTGKGSIMDGTNAVTTQAIEESDGLANTVMILETQTKEGVIWTKPDDFDYTRGGNISRLGRLRGGFAYVAWADGSVGALDMSKSRRLIRGVFGYNDGIRVLRDSVTAPFDAEKMAFGTSGATETRVADAGSSGRTIGAGAEVGAAEVGGDFGSEASYSAPGGVAGKCLTAATSARESGAITDAWNWLYGAVVAELPADSWVSEVKWTPALHRPTLGLHWAVGVTQRSSRGSARRQVSRPEVPSAALQANRQEIVRLTAPHGESLLAMVEKAAAASAPAVIARESSGEQSGQPSTATYLPPSSTVADLLDASDEMGADVLLVFAADKATGNRVKSVTLTFYDVSRRSQLKRIRQINNRDGSEGRRGDSYQKARWELSDFIEDKLTPKEWPVKLTKQLAEKRLSSLGQAEPRFPPRQLIEMRYYRSLGLVDDAQLLQAVNDLLGGEQGVNLLLGNDTKKRRVIRQWLPHDDPAEYLAARERLRRQRQDDDD